MNTVQKFEQRQIAQLTESKQIPEFRVGDTISVNVKIIEGVSERLQAFEGVCIARSNKGVNSSFTLRKISHGEGVERVFPLYSPRLENIKLVRRGEVRRAKLYYMRDLTGKAARITEKRDPKAGAATDNVAVIKAPAEPKAKAAPKAKKAAKA